MFSEQLERLNFNFNKHCEISVDGLYKYKKCYQNKLCVCVCVCVREREREREREVIVTVTLYAAPNLIIIVNYVGYEPHTYTHKHTHTHPSCVLPPRTFAVLVWCVFC